MSQHTYTPGKIPEATLPQWYVVDAEQWRPGELVLIEEYMQEILYRFYAEKGYADAQHSCWYLYRGVESFHARKVTFNRPGPSGETLHHLKRALEVYYGFRKKDE